MNIVKLFAVFTAFSLVLVTVPLSTVFASVASQFTVNQLTATTLAAEQTAVLLDVTLPNPGLDMIVHDASSPTNETDSLASTALRYVDVNGNASYDDGELLVYDNGSVGVLEGSDFHETGTLPTSLLQSFSSEEPNFIGYIDADGNGSYSTGERVLAQEMNGTLGTLATTPDPIPFTLYEKILDHNGNGSYDPFEPVVYDADNSYSLSSGDDILSSGSTNVASSLRRFNAVNTSDQKVCVNDVGSLVGAIDETDKIWWDSSGSCASFTSGVDMMLVGSTPLSSVHIQATSATNMVATASTAWMGYWDENRDGGYTCTRTGSCETLIKSDFITPEIVAGVFQGGEEIFASSTDPVHGCTAISTCVAWDEPNSGIGTLTKELSLYHVYNGSTSIAYGFKSDILDVVDPGTVTNATNGLLRAFPATHRFYESASAPYNGSQAILSITGSSTLATASDIRKTGPITLATLPSNMRFADLNGNGIRETNEDLVTDVDLSATYRSHAIQSMTISNAGSATSSDFQSMKLYQENGASAGWDSGDALIGTWTAPFFNIATSVGGQTLLYNGHARRVYVVGQLSSAPVQGRTVQIEMNVNGVQFWSNLDGPTDQVVMNATGFTIGSSSDVTPPSTPTNFSVAASSAGQNILAWSLPSASDLAGVMVRMSTTGYPLTRTSGTELYTGLGTTYTHVGTPGQLYYYSIFAFDAAGNYSGASSFAATMPSGNDVTPPSPPSNIWASGGNAQITVSWQNPTSDFAQTVVRMSTTGYPSSTTSGTAVYAGSGTSVTTGANNGTTYYFSLWATDTTGNVSSRMIASTTPFAPSVTTTPITLVPSGSLIKAGPSSVYYYSGGKRYVFPNEAVFYSWFPSFDGLYTITDSDMSTVSLGSRITMRPGTYMMKIQSDNRVWAIEPGGIRRWVPSEAVASALYGPNWNQMIVDQDVTLWPDYTEGTPLTTMHANGTVVLLSGNTYVIENAFKRLLSSEGYTANRVQWKHVVQPTVSYVYPTGTTIGSYQAMYSNPVY